MGFLAANATVAVGVVLVGVALLLAITGFLAWRRVGHARLAWVTLAFLALMATAIVLSLQAYARRGEEYGLTDALPLLLVCNLVTTVSLYLGVLKR